MKTDRRLSANRDRKRVYEQKLDAQSKPPQ